ncbi:hypothetical protein BGW39_002728 [Mortierella sp. 14UC]|nr:hypothetical protein BGW39_002728 [Mortierella sp. 14UC]
MLSYRWLLCWLSCAIVLLHAAPLPSPTTPSTTSSSSPIITTTSFTHSNINNKRQSDSYERRSNRFSELLDPAFGFNLNPSPPSLPNVYIPITSPPEPHPEVPPPPTATGSPSPPKPGNVVPTYPSAGFTDVPALIAACGRDRSPMLPGAIPYQVGIVRLFKQASFRQEAAVVKGCGCIPLESPIAIESFVGSENHSFAFYTSADCMGDPFYQRFNQHYDVEPNMIANSIRIYHGVLPPIPMNNSPPK